MDIEYAVENAHDENILTSVLPLDKELNLSCMLSLLTLQPYPEEDNFHCDDEMMRMREQLLILKQEVDNLDRRDDDYYQKKELLIYKIFCEFRGISYEHDCDDDLQEIAEAYEEQ
ncbi:uncharacterized protein LOC132796123 [Drosophila nasuta]|uniref:uncharacterized protein LOC132796123 n=1 Tax=Drosophila nasuta TaxID=42062 RepID=UPI00295EB945|nr:uncharacterized protein LOC132796123 [Drosophila nasuta]